MASSARNQLAWSMPLKSWSTKKLRSGFLTVPSLLPNQVLLPHLVAFNWKRAGESRTAGTFSSAKRSWADVRGSTEANSGLIEESCEGRPWAPAGIAKNSCSTRNANLMLGGVGDHDSERSLIFKRWARGRCYRCLARDHQVRSCKNPFRCIRCRCPGHPERHCRLGTPFSSPHVLPCEKFQRPLFAQSHCQTRPAWNPHQTGSWADVASRHHSPLPTNASSEAPSQEHHSKVSSSLPSPASEKVTNAKYCNYPCHASFASASLEPKALVTYLLESLQSEIEHLFEIQFERVMHPVREEISTIKVWLARVATQLECHKQDKEHLSTLKNAELFGPYSPVRLSSTSTLIGSLAAARNTVDPTEREGTCVDMTDSSSDQKPVEQPVEIPAKPPIAQKQQMSVKAVGQAEDLVRVEDASNNDNQSMIDSTSDITTVARGENFVISSNSTTSASHRIKSFDKSSTRRCARNNPYNFIKGLGLVRKNGKLDKGKLEVFAELVKEILPADLLLPLLRLKGRLFWDALAKMTATLC